MIKLAICSLESGEQLKPKLFFPLQVVIDFELVMRFHSLNLKEDFKFNQ